MNSKTLALIESYFDEYEALVGKGYTHEQAMLHFDYVHPVVLASLEEYVAEKKRGANAHTTGDTNTAPHLH